LLAKAELVKPLWPAPPLCNYSVNILICACYCFQPTPHSLSDCLKLKLQALPTQVIGYLDGQEVNTEAEFDSVRCNFRQELAEALIAR
jgi:hypothetical protein